MYDVVYQIPCNVLQLELDIRNVQHYHKKIITETVHHQNKSRVSRHLLIA